ncbi:MAG TPA: hypothetical protein VJ654_02895 [Noviherbaspirillum sp.]|nr:hypothetical protein [Noviherbaspirillum sp.]
MTDCPKCTAADGGMSFECIACCLRWLRQMTAEEMAINAPVIERVMGLEHMEKVRQAWRNYVAQRSST